MAAPRVVRRRICQRSFNPAAVTMRCVTSPQSSQGFVILPNHVRHQPPPLSEEVFVSFGRHLADEGRDRVLAQVLGEILSVVNLPKA